MCRGLEALLLKRHHKNSITQITFMKKKQQLGLFKSIAQIRPQVIQCPNSLSSFLFRIQHMNLFGQPHKTTENVGVDCLEFSRSLTCYIPLLYCTISGYKTDSQASQQEFGGEFNTVKQQIPTELQLMGIQREQVHRNSNDL